MTTAPYVPLAAQVPDVLNENGPAEFEAAGRAWCGAGVLPVNLYVDVFRPGPPMAKVLPREKYTGWDEERVARQLSPGVYKAVLYVRNNGQEHKGKRCEYEFGVAEGMGKPEPEPARPEPQLPPPTPAAPAATLTDLLMLQLKSAEDRTTKLIEAITAKQQQPAVVDPMEGMLKAMLVMRRMQAMIPEPAAAPEGGGGEGFDWKEMFQAAKAFLATNAAPAARQPAPATTVTQVKADAAKPADTAAPAATPETPVTPTTTDLGTEIERALLIGAFRKGDPIRYAERVADLMDEFEVKLPQVLFLYPGQGEITEHYIKEKPSLAPHREWIQTVEVALRELANEPADDAEAE